MRKKKFEKLKRKYRKLLEWEAKMIRSLRKKFPWMTQQTVGEIFDTVRTNVSWIERGLTWKK